MFKFNFWFALQEYAYRNTEISKVVIFSGGDEIKTSKEDDMDKEDGSIVESEEEDLGESIELSEKDI